MLLRVEDIKLEHRVVGTKHVYTSPDIPQLHVSHADKETALKAVQSALKMFEAMERRLEARRSVNAMKRESVAA